MKRSLQGRLTLLLNGAILVLGLVAALISFLISFGEAVEFQDHMLRQIANLAAGTLAPEPGWQRRFPRFAEEPIVDDDDHIDIYTFADPAGTDAPSLPGWMSAVVSPESQTVQTSEGKRRLFLLRSPDNRLTVVMQPIEIRNEAALCSALQTLIPMALLLPLMTWLIARIIGREFAPLRQLAENLDAQEAARPLPLPEQDIPRELAPFVQAINRLLARVAEMVSQQRRFVGDAAHELRSPLAALSLQIQNLEHGESLEDIRRRIRPLQEGMARTKQLAEQLLNLARLQVGRVSMTDAKAGDQSGDQIREEGSRGPEYREKVDVSRLVRQLIADFLPMAEEKKIDLGLDEAEGQPPFCLYGTEERLHLILKNGLENALKYTPEAGEVTVQLSWQQQSGGERLCCRIVDDGPGVDEAILPQLFEPFFRPAENSGVGCGLGLAIALEAATGLGGNLCLYNRTDRSGTVFQYLQ